MPGKRASVKNEKQYEALKDKGMSKERAARIANSPGASSRGGKEVRLGLELEPGRDERPEEGRWPQGWQGRREEGLTVFNLTDQLNGSFEELMAEILAMRRELERIRKAAEVKPVRPLTRAPGPGTPKHSRAEAA